MSGGAILSASRRLRSAFDRHGSRPETCTSRSSLRCSASSDLSSRSDRLFRRFARVWARAGSTPAPDRRTQVLVLLQHRARFRHARKSPFGEAQPGTGGDGIWTNRAGCRGRSDAARTGSGLDGLLAGRANPLHRPSAEHRRELPDCVNGEVKQAQQIVPG